ncbi:MAG: PAS domain-containing protein [Candidatus Ozemobacteraceae bacterium]
MISDSNPLPATELTNHDKAQGSEAGHNEADLAERNRELETLHRISRTAFQSVSCEMALWEIVSVVSESTGFPFILIELYHRERQVMVFKAATGIPLPDAPEDFEVHVRQALSGCVVLSGKSLVEENPWDSQRYESVLLKKLGVVIYIGVPLRSGGEVVGTLSIGDTKPHVIKPRFIQGLESYGDFIAEVIVRQRTEDALSVSEERLRHAMDATNDGLWDWNVETGEADFNSNYFQMLGFDPGEFPEQFQSWVDLVHPDDRERALRSNVDCVENRAPSFEVEFRMKTRSGEWKWILSRGMAVRRGKDGKALQMVGTHVDITHIKLAEENVRSLNAELEKRIDERNYLLQEAVRELDAFAYSVAYDLRAPLRALDGFSQALLEDYAERLDEQGADFLRRIRAASQRMGQLIDDLLNLARISRMEIHPSRVDISAMAREIIGELEAVNPGRHVTWNIEDKLTGMADRHLFRTALYNLLSNSWKFTSKKTAACIELMMDPASPPKETIFILRDNGDGFDPAHAGNLFAPFRRLHHQNEFPGTGVGLATVQRIIQRHGGRISAEGKPGEGATIHFSLGKNTEWLVD